MIGELLSAGLPGGLSAAEMAAVGLTITLAYGVFGFGGFGANLVALPLLAHLMSLRFAVPMLLMLDLVSAALIGLRNRRLIETGELARLLPTLVIGMGLGVVVLQYAAERWLLLLLGVFVGGFALWSLFGRARSEPVSTRWAWPAGLVGGVFSSMFGTGGPVYTLYLARRIVDTGRLRATIGTLIFGSAFGRLLLFAASGILWQPGLLKMAALLLPFALLGFLIGSRVQARAPQAQVRRAIWLLLLASAVSLLLRAVT